MAATARTSPTKLWMSIPRDNRDGERGDERRRLNQTYSGVRFILA